MKLLFERKHLTPVGNTPRRCFSSINPRARCRFEGSRRIVWEYARENDLMIVSKDSDLHQRSFVLGHPPKVVWVRLGNCSTSDIEKLLLNSYAEVKAFYEDARASFLSLSSTSETRLDS